jgi:hypothetical protein
MVRIELSSTFRVDRLDSSTSPWRLMFQRLAHALDLWRLAHAPRFCGGFPPSLGYASHRTAAFSLNA